jgi:pyrroline-5-carboxylate reductase
MGGAIARGLVTSGALDPTDLVVFDTDASKVADLAEAGANVAADTGVLAAWGPDVLVLAVKPQVLPAVMAELAPKLHKDQLVVSIAAGVPLATLEEALPTARVVRVMPNLPLQVLSGATAVCPGSRATASDAALVQTLFAALGSAQVMTEAQLDVAGAVTGCGPAFFALFVDDLVRAGVRNGLPAVGCREMVLATMRGVAQQLLDSGEHPRAYMEKVTSPGGTTAAGLEAMECPVFEACSEAVDAALERTRELAGA